MEERKKIYITHNWNSSEAFDNFIYFFGKRKTYLWKVPGQKTILEFLYVQIKAEILSCFVKILTNCAGDERLKAFGLPVKRFLLLYEFKQHDTSINIDTLEFHLT